MFQQFLIDGYTMIEYERLSYIRNKHDSLKVDIYNRLADVMLQDETDHSSQRKQIIISSSFIGGAHYTIQN